MMLELLIKTHLFQPITKLSVALWSGSHMTTEKLSNNFTDISMHYANLEEIPFCLFNRWDFFIIDELKAPLDCCYFKCLSVTTCCCASRLKWDHNCSSHTLQLFLADSFLPYYFLIHHSLNDKCWHLEAADRSTKIPRGWLEETPASYSRPKRCFFFFFLPPVPQNEHTSISHIHLIENTWRALGKEWANLESDLRWAICQRSRGLIEYVAAWCRLRRCCVPRNLCCRCVERKLPTRDEQGPKQTTLSAGLHWRLLQGHDCSDL